MIKHRSLAVVVGSLAVSGWLVLPVIQGQHAYAQAKKVTGTGSVVAVLAETRMSPGDDPNHVVSLVRRIDAQKDNAFGESQTSVVATTDAVAGSGPSRGYGVRTLADGDKVFYAYDGANKAVARGDGPPTITFEGKFRYTGGTGKWKTLTGGGVYKGGVTAGVAAYEYEGEYEVK